ncbi:MAG TPA: hypothetical protein VIO38_16895, partial [Rariglobus sp.]
MRYLTVQVGEKDSATSLLFMGERYVGSCVRDRKAQQQQWGYRNGRTFHSVAAMVEPSGIARLADSAPDMAASACFASN